MTLLLALLAGVACDPLEPQQEERVPVSFSAVVSGDMPATRAGNEIDDNAALQAGGFGVFACYTGLYSYSASNASPDFMYNQPVTWSASDNHWVYDPVKYWPNGEGEASGNSADNPHYVSFFAYAPYSDGNGTGCITAFSSLQEQTNPWLLYRLADDVAGQEDLLYAVPLLDQKKPSKSARLAFTFRHALACVGDAVTVTCDNELLDGYLAEVSAGTSERIELRLTKVKVTYTLTAKARMVLWNNAKANWSAVLSEDVLTTRTQTLLNGTQSLLTVDSGNRSVSSWSDTGNGVFCIPIEVAGSPQKAKVEITCQIVKTKNGVPTYQERSVSSEFLLTGLLEEGKRTDININLKYL